jgi:hypothetical protein
MVGNAGLKATKTATPDARWMIKELHMMMWYDKLFLTGMILMATGGGMVIWGFAAMIFAKR